MPPRPTTISSDGVNLIASFEGFQSAPYWDGMGKVWTIGFGSTFDPSNNPVTSQTPPISREIALEWLQHAVNGVCAFINEKINPDVVLTQHQYDAICSLAYNIGIGNFEKSNLLKNLNSHQPVIEDNFTSWDEAGGKIISGLLTRRLNEWKYYEAV